MRLPFSGAICVHNWHFGADMADLSTGGSSYGGYRWDMTDLKILKAMDEAFKKPLEEIRAKYAREAEFLEAWRRRDSDRSE